MLAISFNSRTSKATRRKYRGRDYYVSNAVLIVEGVLNGSDGEIYYPADESSRSAMDWNGIPLTLRHPTQNGIPVSARSPEILDAYELGRVFNVRMDGGKLVGEAWFDIVRVNEIDLALPEPQKLRPRLESGKPIELSTGLFLRREERAGTFNGRAYKAVARDYRPDHLAVLPDDIGACSVNDGCGINVNQAQNYNPTPIEEVMTPEQKKETIAFITANCSCWKNDAATLEGFASEKLNAIKAEVLATNALKAENERLKATPPTLVPQLPAPAPTPAPANNTAAATVPTFQDLLAAAPPEVRATWNNAVAIVNAEKARLIGELVANVAPDAKQSAITVYSGMQVEQLRTLASAMPKAPPAATVAAAAAPDFIANYFGIGVPGTQAPITNDDNDILRLPVYDWSTPAGKN